MSEPPAKPTAENGASAGPQGSPGAARKPETPAGAAADTHAAALASGAKAPTPQARPIRRPIVVAPDNTKRDTIIAVGSGVIVLALVLYGIVALRNEQGRPSTNQVTGVIVARHASGER